MKAILWSKYNCPYFDQAKLLLTQRGYEIEEKKLGDGYTKDDLLTEIPTAKSLPQIFLEGKHIGGYTELKQILLAA